MTLNENEISLLNNDLRVLLSFCMRLKGFHAFAQISLNEEVGCCLIEFLHQLRVTTIDVEALVEDFGEKFTSAQFDEFLRTNSIAVGCVNVVT